MGISNSLRADKDIKWSLWGLGYLLGLFESFKPYISTLDTEGTFPNAF